MSYYAVHYKTPNGNITKEYFQFPHLEQLTNFLGRRQIDVIKIKKVTKFLVGIHNFFIKKIVDEEILELVNHLHIIVNSGLPLHQSLEDLALENENPKLKKILFSLSTSIQTGHSLSSSMEAFHKIFGFSTIYLIRIGEETGTLNQTLNKAKEFLTQSMKLKKEVRLALIYPLIVLSVALVAITVWFTFVLPQMAEMFGQMQIELPPLTKFLIFMGDIISQSYLYVIFLIFLFSLVLHQANKRSQSVHKQLTRFTLKMPLAGKIIKELNIAYITEFLYLSLSTGTSLFKAINIISENMRNVVYQESMKQVKKHLENGLSLSEALQKEQLYNAFTIRMLNMGEQSGDLESQLYTVSHYYQESVQTATTQMTKIIEPAMIIFVGAIFALIMLGLMGPIFDMVAHI